MFLKTALPLLVCLLKKVECKEKNKRGNMCNAVQVNEADEQNEK
jgi:hypothetical protein